MSHNQGRACGVLDCQTCLLDIRLDETQEAWLTRIAVLAGNPRGRAIRQRPSKALPRLIATCQWCGGEFTAGRQGPPAKWCSENCRRQYRYKQRAS